MAIPAGMSVLTGMSFTAGMAVMVPVATMTVGAVFVSRGIRDQIVSALVLRNLKRTGGIA